MTNMFFLQAQILAEQLSSSCCSSAATSTTICGAACTTVYWWRRLSGQNQQKTASVYGAAITTLTGQINGFIIASTNRI